jgi:hypothetical protein
LLGDAETVTFRLLGPLGTVTVADRPTLRWEPVAGATGYTVTLQDETTGVASSSSAVEAAEWMPPSALTRGHRYVWQVAAVVGGTEIVAPQPPAPAAKFQVLDEATATSLERLPASNLVRGILYAQAGALDDAELELMALSARNPGSPAAEALLERVRAARRLP